jgi:hypothetical protein
MYPRYVTVLNAYYVDCITSYLFHLSYMVSYVLHSTK